MVETPGSAAGKSPRQTTPTPPYTPPVAPHTKRQHGSDSDSDEDPFDDAIDFSKYQNPTQQLPDPSALESDAEEDVGSSPEDGQERVTCDLDTLAGETFGYWITKPKEFALKVLKTSVAIIETTSVEDQAIEEAWNTLSEYVDVTKRSVPLKSVIQQIDTIGSLQLLTASKDVMSIWAPPAHWARFLVLLKAKVADGPQNIFEMAKIRGEHAVNGCLWVFAKIIARNRRPADFKRLTNRLKNRGQEAAKAALISATEGATFGLSKAARAHTARATVDRLASRGVPKTKPALKRLKLSEDIVHSSESEDDSSDEEPLGPPVSIQGLSEEAIIQSYIDDMDKEAAKKALDKDQVVRRRKAAKSVFEHMRSLNLRPAAHMAYYRNLALLYNCARYHFDDIKTIYKPKRIINKIRKKAKENFERQNKAAKIISNAVEESAPTDKEVLGSLDKEAKTELHAKNTKNDEEVEPLCVVDIPEGTIEDPTADLFSSSKINNKFAPTYLTKACVEAKIVDGRKKLMPGMNFPLRWWQVIATKWVTDLTKNETNIFGGIIADMIGLGKTVQAGACIQKMINQYRDEHDPMLAEFRKEHPPLPRPVGAPERPGDFARPSLYITPASLCHQTAKELAQMSKDLVVTLIGGDPNTSHGVYKTVDALPSFTGSASTVWDTADARNIRKVYVISYNLLSKHYGPQHFWNNVVNNQEKFCKARGLNHKTYDHHKYMENIDNSPDDAPSGWVRSFKGRFNFVFADEGQDGLRNPSSFWRVVRWMKPAALFIMSGYPAPRGMEDFGSYIHLLERPALKEEHDTLTREYNELIKSGKESDLPDYLPGITNPYELPEDDPNSKFCFLYSSWKTFITCKSSPNYNDRIEQGRIAQRALERIVLRRDFDSALPAGSANTIGRSIPPKHHYTVERMFTPSALRIYNNQFARWKTRLFTTHRNSSGSNVPAMNARANKASQIIDFFPPAGYLHIEMPAEKRPQDFEYGDGDDRLDEKYNRDRESWYYDKSALFIQYDALPAMKPGGRGERLRWIMNTCRDMGWDDIDENQNFSKMSNADLAECFLKWSPKMQAILGLIMDWCLLRDEKVIFWFMTPVIQEMAQTVLELLGHDVFAVYSSNNGQERMEAQDAWNSQKSHKRMLLASALVFGTGYNLQKDSRVGVMVDTPDTDNREKQILGRQFRGGQTLEVHFFRLTVHGTHSIARLSENLLGSLSASSAFLNYGTAGDSDLVLDDLGAPLELVERVTDNYLEGFIRIPDCENPTSDADYQYFFIFSPQGLEYVKQERLDSDKDKDWWPSTLPYTTALAGIAARTDTRRIRRVAGFPEEFVEELIELTSAELAERKVLREKENDDVDPDDRFYTAKTPSKKKPTEERSRIKDKRPSVSAITWPSSSKPLSPEATTSTATVKKEVLDIKEDDVQRASRIPDILAKNEVANKAEESDYTDFDEGGPTYNEIMGRIRSHKTYRPTREDIDMCDATQKRHITLAIKAHDPNYKAPAAPKKKKTKGKDKKKVATGNSSD